MKRFLKFTNTSHDIFIPRVDVARITHSPCTRCPRSLVSELLRTWRSRKLIPFAEELESMKFMFRIPARVTAS